LASSLKKNHVEIEYLDLALDPPLVLPVADVYGLTCTVGTWPGVRDLTRTIRKLNPISKIVIGGALPTVEPWYVLENSDCNAVALGESDETLIEWLHSGTAHGFINKASEEFSVPAVVPDLDSLPFPDRDLVPINVLRHDRGVHGDCYIERDCVATTIITSRGCPYRCAFCSKYANTERVRLRSAQNVYSEMIHIRERYGISHFRFIDDIFTVNNQRVIDLCEMLEGEDLYWLACTRADRVNPTILQAMYDGGCREVMFGVETGSPSLLKKMGKRETHEQIEKAIWDAKEVGLKVKTLLIFGFPGENRETINQTKDFLMRTKPDKFTLSTYIPLPGSEVWANPAKFDVEILDRNFGQWFYYEPEELTRFVIKYPNNEELLEIRPEFLRWIRSKPWRNQ
jgi:radical SAM superfamily enzyme YgiQ (UPF0313 family)